MLKSLRHYLIRLLQTWDEKNEKPATPKPSTETTIQPQEKITEKIGKPKDFLTRYLNYLQGDHAYLKFQGLSASHIPAISLDSVYITLKAVAGEGEREEQRIELSEIEQAQEKACFTQETLASEFLETHFYQDSEALQNTNTVEELMVKYPRLVIVGEPGSGKSTILDYILLRLIRDAQYFAQLFNFPNAPIPLFLPLRFLKPQALPTPQELPQFCIPDVLMKNQGFDAWLSTLYYSPSFY